MKTLRHVLRIGLPLLLLACVDFDGQTLSFRYDAKSDRLLIFQHFEGIHTDGDAAAPSAKAKAKGKAKGKKKKAKPRSPTEKERRELESVVKGQRTFFFGNWITEYNRADCEADIVQSSAKLASLGEPEKAALKARIAVCRQLVASVKITNGKFFLNKQGQLCGYQLVVVEQVSKLLPLINDAIRTFVATDPMDKITAAGREKVRAFAKKGRWVELEGGELRIRYYDTYDEFLELREGLLKQFLQAQIILNYDEPLIEIIIGRKGNKRTTLTTPSKSKPDRRLIRHVRKTYGIEKKVDVDSLRERFLESGEASPAPASVPGSKP